MSPVLPNLDDRRWLDLVDEARALIPIYAPEWTDHNPHDPGITLVELLAYLTDGALYRGNQVTDRHRLLMLGLAGVHRAPLAAARAVLTFRAAAGNGPVRLPATTELASGGVAFRTRRTLTVTEAAIGGVWTRSGNDLKDLSAARTRGDVLELFGRQPAAGAELLLGLAGRLNPGEPISLFFEIDSRIDRRPLVHERRERAMACRPPSTCGRSSHGHRRRFSTSRQHHDAQTVWEYRNSTGSWRALDAVDLTRAFTLSDRVVIRVPADPSAQPFADRTDPLFMLRCRLSSGALDAPALARRIWINAVEAEQAVPIAQALAIAPHAAIEGTAPANGGRTRLLWRLSGTVITFLRFDHDEGPSLSVLEFSPPNGAMSGRLVIGGSIVGFGTGGPNQRVAIGVAPVVPHGFELWSFENGAHWERWRRADDLIGSGRAARDFVLDEMTGLLRFGDGQRGRVPPIDAALVVTARTSLGGDGNTPAATLTILDSPRNRARLGDIEQVRDALEALEQPAAAHGGANREGVSQTAARAALERESTSRAVTLADVERLIRELPGASVARVKAWANTAPHLLGFDAPGVVTIVVAPAMPVPRPTPSPGLLRAIAACLARRRVLGTRFEIVGPEYRTISVAASVRALPGQAPAAVAARVRLALDTFLDPLRGGKDGLGWPFGRDVYRSEVLESIDRVGGVDHVRSLALVADGGPPECGNVCVSPLALTTPGAHHIEVD